MEGSEEGEKQIHYFCRLTFGQFFTLIVLEVITLSFVFYLGARYGNEYLKLDVIGESRRGPVSIVSGHIAETNTTIPSPTRSGQEDLSKLSDDDLREMARKVLKGQEDALKSRVEDILSKDEGVEGAAVQPTGDVQGMQADTEEIQLPGRPIGGMEPDEAEIKMQESNYNIVFETARKAADSQAGGGAETGDFSVQVGAYPDVKEASYRVEEWKARGYPAFMEAANLGEKGTWYRIRIGKFAKKEEADRFLENLVSKEGIEDAFVTNNE